MMKESVVAASVAALGMAAYALIQRRENRDERDEPEPEPEPISAEEAQRRQQARRARLPHARCLATSLARGPAVCAAGARRFARPGRLRRAGRGTAGGYRC